MVPPRIAKAENDLLFDEDQRQYIDLFSAHGTAWLGHANREIGARIAEQLQRVWITGGLESSVGTEARAMVERFFPSSHGLAALYSTGMEAAEFALRVARVLTKRSGLIGFDRGMHGKSLATAFLGWENRSQPDLPEFQRLPFVSAGSEEGILGRLRDSLVSRPPAAVFVEPVQGCGGGCMASARFYQHLFRLCRDQGVLLIFDEILTGFYRTGTLFFFSELGFVPDIILIGKALGNGFPVSGVVMNRQYRIQKEMLPGSTYSGNALAAAAVLATLQEMQALDLAALVAGIEKTVTSALGSLSEYGMVLRGKGALWLLELPAGMDIEKVVVNIYRRGVAIGYAGQYLRILPAATISPGNLAKACAVVSDELQRAYHES